CKDQAVFTDKFHNKRQRLLIRLKGVIDLLAAHVLARRFFHQRHCEMHIFVVLIQPLHPVWHPTASRFQKSDFQFWEPLEDTATATATKPSSLTQRASSFRASIGSCMATSATPLRRRESIWQ